MLQGEWFEKINVQELWFLCMTRRLNVLYKCMKFRWIISNGYHVIERTRFCDGQTTPGNTDRQTDSRVQGENNMSSGPSGGGGGGHNEHLYEL